MSSLLLMLALLSSTEDQAAPRCLDERTGRAAEIETSAYGKGRVDVWWDLHCAFCHVLIDRLSSVSDLQVVAHRVGAETGDRAQALRALPPNVHACRAVGTPPSRGLPYSEWRSPQGHLLAAWTGSKPPTDVSWKPHSD